jgi:hypothetical protein
MTLKHVEDDGDLALFINHDGELLFLCLKCKDEWTASATLLPKRPVAHHGAVAIALDETPKPAGVVGHRGAVEPDFAILAENAGASFITDAETAPAIVAKARASYPDLFAGAKQRERRSD